jgi:hypothetical protein
VFSSARRYALCLKSGFLFALHFCKLRDPTLCDQGQLSDEVWSVYSVQKFPLQRINALCPGAFVRVNLATECE